ncbi:MAG: glutamine-hydrolyzing GMP synthase [Candidatus Chisholmbacteria bacterium]|nr:glutamine-hydrolyzing GMP synthase [Candidatus Chisholmbacteria bacterium]
MILVVDFGSQTAHLISRRIRDLGVPVQVVEPEKVMQKINGHRSSGIIFSGGPAFVNVKGSPTIDKKVFDAGIPILGICYGMQLTGYLLEGKVKPGKVKEFGPAVLQINTASKLFAGFSGKPFQVWMSHGDTVLEPPKGFDMIASTADIKGGAMHDEKRKIYCIQFHPEVEHTRFGKLMLRNFVAEICGLKTKNHRTDLKGLIAQIKRDIGRANALCAVSGGVDSTVAAALVARAVGKQLVPVYIESGLMRLGTAEEVRQIFTKQFKIQPVIVEARKEFLTALKGVKDPEEKRQAIGALYIKLFEKEAKKHKGMDVLVQGTIYSDVIESKGTKHADKIKSHHNGGGLPKELGVKLVEPLRGYYKDEVRKIGRRLGLPRRLVQKQVFPGPGQAIRIVGAVTEKRLAQQQQADQIVLEEMEKSGWLKRVYMSFPIMTGAPSTAVKGDGRFFGEVVALRIIESKDVMTTNWARLPHSLLQKMSSRIVNEVPDVSRVVYDITTKPPATMEWE